jgi:hypothetical protein
MAIQKVWNEELQEWVYDDPDLPEDLEFGFSSKVEINQGGRFRSDSMLKATLPFRLLEEVSKCNGSEDK